MIFWELSLTNLSYHFSQIPSIYTELVYLYLFHSPGSEGVTAAAALPNRFVVEGIDREDAVGAAIEALDSADEGPALRGV